MVERHSDPAIHELATIETDRRALRHRADVHAFQYRLFEKLIRHNAYSPIDGLGWAIFNDRQIDNNFVVTGIRKVLLLGLVHEDDSGNHVAVSRIITNEKFNTKGRFSILSEDMTVDGHGNAAYMTSATLRYAAHSRTPFRPEDTEPEMSLGVVFSSAKKDIVLEQDFGGEMTPILRVSDPNKEYMNVYPFGNCEVLSDNQYALGKAIETLSHVQAMHPVQSYQRH